MKTDTHHQPKADSREAAVPYDLSPSGESVIDGRAKNFIVRVRGNSVPAHIWIGADTACRMASTGGLKLERYRFLAAAGERKICQMCLLSYRPDGAA